MRCDMRKDRSPDHLQPYRRPKLRFRIEVIAQPGTPAPPAQILAQARDFGIHVFKGDFKIAGRGELQYQLGFDQVMQQIHGQGA